MNKIELIKKLSNLDDISQDEKAYLINLVNTKKKYGLVWEDKPEEVEEQLRESLPVLVPKIKDGKPLNIINGNEYPNHVLIEGDNLHALTALTFTHEGKVDIIYIDPPYNTGKDKEFRYNDRWVLNEDPFKHSMWLSFIAKRLNISKRLLNDKGILIVHIDENEFDALNLLVETEIFSEDSVLGVIVWNKQNPKGDAKGVANMHEYLLVYAKNKSEFVSLENALMRPKTNALKILNKAKRLYSKLDKIYIPDEIKEVIKPFNYSKEILDDFKVKYDLELINKEFQSWMNRQDFSNGEKAYKMIDENGKVYQSVSMAWPNKDLAPKDYFIPLLHPISKKECPVPSRGWRNPPPTMKDLLDKNLILFGNDETTQPRRKYYLEENLFENTPSIYNNGSSDDDLFEDLGISFPYPKPIEVASYLLKSIHPDPKIILDFFAGSGTALHATMQLNDADGGNRQCILVTNNENNIAEEVCYERNKRVIQGYSNPNGESVRGLINNNLRYYKCDFVGRNPSLKNKRALTLLATELLCIKEDCYTECTTQIIAEKQSWTKFFNGPKERLLCIIYNDSYIDDVVEIIKNIVANKKHQNKIKIYVFSNGQYPYTEEFEDVLDHITLCALPDAIYKAYQNVLPKRHKKVIPELEEDSTEEVELLLEKDENMKITKQED